MSIHLISPQTGRSKVIAAASPLVLLLTDARDVAVVPEPVRRAADLFSTEDLSVWRGEILKGGANGAIVWIEGDQLLRGTSEDLRGVFFTRVPATTLVPVHLPCLPEADLVGVQPRVLVPGAAGEAVTRAIRLGASASPSAAARQVWNDCGQPWAGLHLALLGEKTAAGAAEPLKELWQKRKLFPELSSLVLRNLIVTLLRERKYEKAEELLTLGLRAFPGYAELEYLTAVLWLRRGKVAQAVAPLERALRGSRREYVGSGGETSYRSGWLLGTICEQIGDQEQALARFLPGAYERPAFAPSVTGILRQQLSRFRAEQLQQPLCELVRREPLYLGPVFDFFLRHRVLAPPRRLLRTLPLPAEARETLQERLSAAERRLRPAPRTAAEKAGVAFEGSFLLLSGHARINQALGCALLESDRFDVALEPSESGTAAARVLPQRETIARGLHRHPDRLDLTLRHQWPPDFRPPVSGRLACIVPWEHRAVPRAWVREIERSVDELWVPSQFVAGAFIDGGVATERVQVIPNGFAPEIFHPKVTPWRPAGCRSCAFLFVGGAILRKGVDLLLQAYTEAFSEDDDVTLIFKDTGAASFYRHNSLLPRVQKAARRGGAPIVALTEEMDDRALASLYRGCDALVLPYRGEGFGMPLLEAMACGRPVVTTAAGPALEFCPPEDSYLLPAIEVPVTEPPPPLGEFSGEWTWFEPSLCDLSEALRNIYEQRHLAAQRGQRAAARVARTHTWPRITERYIERIAQLTTVPAAHPLPAFAGVES